jgi:hypothetical protein
MRRLLIAAALAGCNLPTTDGLDPSSVTTGVYTLTATSQSDTCNPQRFVGSVTVPIFADDTVIVIADQNSSVTAPTIARYNLPAADSYDAQVPPAGASIPACPSGGTFSLGFTLTTASASEFDVAETETWTIATPCPDTTIDAATVPSASCTAARTLHYTLVQSCAAPCTIVEQTGVVPSCSCPQGGSGSGSGSL